MNLLILAVVSYCQWSRADIFGSIPKIGLTDLKPPEDVINLTKIEDHIKTTIINYSEDGLLDFKGLAVKYVKPAEEYDVVTEDGYILTIFRIPGKGCVILISHGAINSSDDFIIRGKTSLIYMLAELGYDVWVINYRGNRYSRRHQTLNPDLNPTYWDFSMHERGYYDLAAVIDFVLNKTCKNQLSIIGHSEGSATGFVLLSTRPEYNKKINVFIATAPACYIANSGVGLKTFVRIGPALIELLKVFRINEICGYNSLCQQLIALICSQGTAGYELCLNGLFAIFSGYEYGNIEPGIFLTILGHLPAGSSRKNFEHYIQIGEKDRFAEFDFGEQNRAVYGEDESPLYDLKKVTCDVALVSAKNDLAESVHDTERLKSELFNVIDYYIVSDDNFTHADYLWGKNAHIVLYPYIIGVLNKYKCD